MQRKNIHADANFRIIPYEINDLHNNPAISEVLVFKDEVVPVLLSCMCNFNS
jgi:hypothetical protein